MAWVEKPQIVPGRVRGQGQKPGSDNCLVIPYEMISEVSLSSFRRKSLCFDSRDFEGPTVDRKGSVFIRAPPKAKYSAQEKKLCALGNLALIFPLDQRGIFLHYCSLHSLKNVSSKDQVVKARSYF